MQEQRYSRTSLSDTESRVVRGEGGRVWDFQPCALWGFGCASLSVALTEDSISFPRYKRSPRTKTRCAPFLFRSISSSTLWYANVKLKRVPVVRFSPTA